MEPAQGLGWPDQPLAWTPESAGLHHGHAEPEGPELSDGPRAASASPPSEADGLGWPQNSFNDAPPVPVHLIWRRHDPHPATHAAVALIMDLYRESAGANAKLTR